MMNNFIILLIIFIIIFMIIFSQTNHIPNNKQKNNFNDLSLLEVSNDLNNTNFQGFENELLYTSDDLKEGSYINQFKEIDYNNMKLSNNQIGFNPQPKCSSGPLPFANINVNYLLKD
jgi:hypothetical protein